MAYSGPPELVTLFSPRMGSTASINNIVSEQFLPVLSYCYVLDAKHGSGTA